MFVVVAVILFFNKVEKAKSMGRSEIAKRDNQKALLVLGQLKQKERGGKKTEKASQGFSPVLPQPTARIDLLQRRGKA